MQNEEVSDVIPEALQRLRASRDAVAERREAEGEAAGQSWATHHADYEQLEAVAALDVDEGWDGEPGAYGWCAGLLDAINGEGEWSRTEVEQFGEQWFGKPYPSAEEVRGFIRGAAEVFEQV